MLVIEVLDKLASGSLQNGNTRQDFLESLIDVTTTRVRQARVLRIYNRVTKRTKSHFANKRRGEEVALRPGLKKDRLTCRSRRASFDVLVGAGRSGCLIDFLRL